MNARWLRVGALAIAFAIGGGCSSALRFKDQPVVWRIDDTRTIPEPDPDDAPVEMEYVMDGFVTRRLPRALELRDSEPAHNTNALDEVPDSTWFENRIGTRRFTPEEVGRGPGGGPPKLPLLLTKGKVKGKNAGFFAKDATGKKYLIKFDGKEHPEMQTGAAAIGVRLFWAIGYHVPSEHVFELRREQIRVDPKATYETPVKQKRPFTDAMLEDVLARAPRLPDGSYRALASEMLDGKPMGSWEPEGTREGDPNDIVPHEHRRELRGLRVFAAWLGHTDMSEGNSLDMYVKDRGRKFIRHYLVDLGEVFGGYGTVWNREADGFEQWIDWEAQTKGLFSFGLWVRPWERQRLHRFRSIGRFSASQFDPDDWREAYPFFPFTELTAADAFWAAKIIHRFDREHLRAAVAAGQLSDPRAVAYLVETVWRRREIIGHTYLEALTPLDELTIDSTKICATDLAMRHGYARYGVLEIREDDQLIAQAVPNRTGLLCFQISYDERYRVYRLLMRRPDGPRDEMEIHFKGGPRARILGVVRER